MFTVYVLHSLFFDKTYIGYTSDIENRMVSHNHLATKGYTIKYRPGKIIHTEVFETKTEVLSREKQLKTSTGRTFIKELINHSSDG